MIIFNYQIVSIYIYQTRESKAYKNVLESRFVNMSSPLAVSGCRWLFTSKPKRSNGCVRCI